MSLQDDIFDIEDFLKVMEGGKVLLPSLGSICKTLFFLEEEEEKLRKENYILRSAIKIVGE